MRNMEHDSESELINRVVDGDTSAFHRLVDEHAPYLFRMACGLVPSAGDAEDVLQETFLAAYVQLRRFAGKSTLRTWLAGILLNQAALWRRKRTRYPRLAAELEDEPNPQLPVSHAVDAKLDVQRMLQALSPEHREVLVMRECQQMTYDEIATALGVPRGTVESRIFRARQELRQRYGEFA